MQVLSLHSVLKVNSAFGNTARRSPSSVLYRYFSALGAHDGSRGSFANKTPTGTRIAKFTTEASYPGAVGSSTTRPVMPFLDVNLGTDLEFNALIFGAGPGSAPDSSASSSRLSLVLIS